MNLKRGVSIALKKESHTKQLESVKDGRQDIAFGVVYDKAISDYAYYSVPYRYLSNNLYVNAKKKDELDVHAASDLIAALEHEDLKIGALIGYTYADPAINAWINDPKNASKVLFAPSDEINLANLSSGTIDCFIMDPFVAIANFITPQVAHHIREVRLDFTIPIYTIFSKKTISQAFVTKFNQGIQAQVSTSAYYDERGMYLRPLALLHALHESWFSMMLYIGTIAFAISGVTIAFREDTTLLGAFVYAFLPSVGGGILQEVIFGYSPVTMLQDPIYIYLVLGTVLFFFGLIKVGGRLMAHSSAKIHSLIEHKGVEWVLMVCDTIGMASFTVYGLMVTVLMKIEPLWLWGSFFSVIAGAGGSIIRDLMTKEGDIVSLHEETPFAEVAFFWGAFLAIYLGFYTETMPDNFILIGVFLTLGGAFFSRIFFHVSRIPNAQFHISTFITHSTETKARS